MLLVLGELQQANLYATFLSIVQAHHHKYVLCAGPLFFNLNKVSLACVASSLNQAQLRSTEYSGLTYQV
jgi:hypothetical protein